MRVVIALFVCALLGLIGFVVRKEWSRPKVQKNHRSDLSSVVRITKGECIDVAANVPAKGLTVVEFTADL